MRYLEMSIVLIVSSLSVMFFSAVAAVIWG